jgi:hypothetical protein
LKIDITGASNFLRRLYEACGPYQWAREFLVNAVEAGATKILFGLEWQAVQHGAAYRRTVLDNGEGMSADELLRFFSTLGRGAKSIGGVHENYGIGAKIASVPWNPEGVVVLSYRDGRGAMIWIVLNADTGDYELVEFDVEGGRSCVIEPAEVDGVDWAAVAPDWVRPHGTVVVLLGSDERPDTVLGNPEAGEREIKGLSLYLNSRFWDLSSVEVAVTEVRSDHKEQWPQGPHDRDDARRPNKRQIRGARHYLTDVAAAAGRPLARGVVPLDQGRVRAEWYLWEGDRPAVDSYARKGGYVAVRYKGELYQLTSGKVPFRWFGVIEHAVQQNLTLVLEPQHYTGESRWGVHPDQSRNRLIFTGDGEKGVDLPLSDWGLEFAENMPEAVREAIRQARGGQAGTIEDEDYRKRLQDRFGDRWTTRTLVTARRGQPGTQSGAGGDEEVEVFDDPDPHREHSRRKRRRTVKVVRKRAAAGGPDAAVEREAPVDVPRYRFAHASEFERPWHLALWAPNDPEGPTVLLNVDSPVLQEVVEYHQAHYPDVVAEEVGQTVRQVFGEVAACKVAHSQKLTRKVPEEELDRDYRSEQALTVALMGLLAEESVIAQRLARLGRRKPQAAGTVRAG